MEEKIKELRVKIDYLANLVKEENKGKIGGSSEMYESYKSLILSKAWLGKVLEALGTTNPYKSGYKAKEDIEPTADVAPKVSILNMNHIEKVDFLRTKIQELLDTRMLARTLGLLITDLQGIEKHFDYNYWNAINQYYNHLSEAKFWLGFELQRIKEEK